MQKIKNNFSTSFLTLVGAGPGDPELITVKGLKAVQDADIILYDSLVNPKIFDLAFCDNQYDNKRELIFVGKRHGKESITQDEINNLILEKLQAGKNVLRLKGGDPFIFGRGVEEVEFVNKHGYNAYIIPGLTSGIAVPVSCGVALTLREKSDSLHLVTGHEITPEKIKLWIDILQAGSTLVIYMGLLNLVQIMENLKLSLGNDVKVIAIQNGTLENEKIIKTTLNNLAQDIINSSLQAPVILVVGLHIDQELETHKSLNLGKILCASPGKYISFGSF